MALWCPEFAGHRDARTTRDGPDSSKEVTVEDVAQFKQVVPLRLFHHVFFNLLLVQLAARIFLVLKPRHFQDACARLRPSLCKKKKK